MIDSAGATTDELITILLTEGVETAFMLDGGGSSQTVFRGRTINEYSGDNGFIERSVVDFLYFAKDTKSRLDQDVLNAYKDIGDLGKIVSDLNAGLVGFFNKVIYVDNLNNIDKNGMYWALETSLNHPESNQGYSVAIIHFEVPNLIDSNVRQAMQFSIPYSTTTSRESIEIKKN
ncbi:phosphodiester glycosidase family protein [Paraliobacillus ryukyuensis]|uniref:phosphodiester glycosidase family protein n=1 Tax=Paraliobacillus ryukyuensis TaxID=200904 RepID=UPI0009A5E56F|nr:phosphodiester glycosidase family protein [Paraliobacillus ryukyuensis]